MTETYNYKYLQLGFKRAWPAIFPILNLISLRVGVERWDLSVQNTNMKLQEAMLLLKRQIT
jgi:hypothetical protein